MVNKVLLFVVGTTFLVNIYLAMFEDPQTRAENAKHFTNIEQRLKAVESIPIIDTTNIENRITNLSSKTDDLYNKINSTHTASSVEVSILRGELRVLTERLKTLEKRHTTLRNDCIHN